ncbi:hypothetical protein [Synechococcus sp. PCC 6312]|uniref:hypothetical protein n=1 Tax=Synechococcus sp. (strain ATCC 27167 / PCC 6312) TaxID=195253 RepID=UPI00029ED0A2|nr:hypothetical protein [Synechococcus sp. PCC 6312]AFY60717.1 hypothetical protein Syn6312_1555 [Synechococcus sp. PCC 6312]
MSLHQLLSDIQRKLRGGHFANEASVSQGIVLPILHFLAWPVFDTQVVAPEYSLAGGRVDFALCHPQAKSQVFIEVKKVGQSEGADQQLFQYAFHQGVPMAVLTDGQEWHFYLPGEQGNYQERRVYKLDILEREITESEQRLRRYLSYQAWCQGQALKDAREDYQGIAKERQIELTLPRAWERLLAEADEPLVNLLSEQVENLCGFKPNVEIVTEFISRQSSSVVKLTQANLQLTNRSPKTQVNLPKATPVTSRSNSPGNLPIGFAIHGNPYPARSGRDVMCQIFEMLSEKDPTFLDRFAARKHGKKDVILLARVMTFTPNGKTCVNPLHIS